MAENSAIEWCDHTFNPWIGCTKVGPGCDHCYAETLMDTRYGRVQWGAGNPRSRTSAANWKLPEKWNRDAAAFMAAHGHRQRVFCASLADVFDNEVDPQWRFDLFKLISYTPGLDWLLLTKRIGNARQMLEDHWGRNLPDQLWLGITVVNQEEADRDIPKLLEIPARVRWLSCEPLLGPITLRWASWEPLKSRGTTDHLDGLRRLDWVVVGGESGKSARPLHPDWARSIRDQCVEAGVPFLFKQWGERVPAELDADKDETPWRVYQNGERRWSLGEAIVPRDQWKPITFPKIGKKAAGRLLDGVQHDGYPA